MNKCGCVRDSPSKSIAIQLQPYKVVVLIENLAVDPIADGMLSFLCTVLFVERVQLCKCEIGGKILTMRIVCSGIVGIVSRYGINMGLDDRDFCFVSFVARWVSSPLILVRSPITFFLGLKSTAKPAI